MSDPMTPFYSHERASELAATINAYWSDRGWNAGAHPFIIRTCPKEGPLWGVTSKLVAGLPTEREAGWHKRAAA